MRKFATVSKRVFDKAKSSGLITKDDCETIYELIDALDSTIVDVQSELMQHPRFLACVGYYFQYFVRLANSKESSMDSMWLSEYETLKNAKVSSLSVKSAEVNFGRFSEKSVSASVSGNQKYQELKRSRDMYKYLADQMGELKSAFNARTRMLEQFSNNQRKEMGDTE